MAEVQSAIDVATSERDLLLKQQQEAKDRLAGAQEALAAAKRVAAEKEAEIQQISSDMEAQRFARLAIIALILAVGTRPGC
jgi:chromosome segregation ATPase